MGGGGQGSFCLEETVQCADSTAQSSASELRGRGFAGNLPGIRAARSGRRCHKLQSVDQQIAPGGGHRGYGRGGGGHRGAGRRGRPRGAVQAFRVVSLSKHLGYEGLRESLLLLMVLLALRMWLLRLELQKGGATGIIVRWSHSELVMEATGRILRNGGPGPGGIARLAAGKWRCGDIDGRRHAAGTGVRRELTRCLAVTGGKWLPARVLAPPIVGGWHVQVIQIAADLVQLPHVLLQIEVPAESLGADAAGVGLLVVVRVHVEGEVVDLVEGLVADVALVGLFAAVGQLVVLVVALLVEPFAAVLAHEGLVAGVDARVGVEGGGAIEGLAAGLALVRLFRRVDDLVPAESRSLAESLAADLAHKRPGSGVDGHVAGEVVVGVEHLATFQAGEGLGLAATGRSGTAVLDGSLRRGGAGSGSSGGSGSRRWWRRHLALILRRSFPLQVSLQSRTLGCSLGHW